MIFLTKKLLPSIALFAGIVCASEQELVDLHSLSLEELLKIKIIVVTSERRSEEVQDIPLAITAIGGAEMESRGISNVADLGLRVPGLTFGRTGTNGAQVTLRGVGSENPGTGGDPGVAVHLDGVYLHSTNYTVRDFFDTERVEVLRGPQGTLYGRNATGGSINIISRAPKSEFSARGRFTVGNYSQQLFQAAVNGTIVEDRLLGRLSLSTELRDGYAENVSPLATESDIGDSDYWALRGQLKFFVSDKIDATLRGSICRDDSVVPPFILLSPYPTEDVIQGFDVRTNPPTPVFANYYVLNNAPLNPSVKDRRKYRADFSADSGSDIEGSSLEINWHLSGAILTAITGYNRNDTFNRFDGDSSDVVFFEARDVRTKSNTVSQEIRLASPSDIPLEWIGGLYYFQEKSSFLADFAINNQPDLFGTPLVFIIDTAHVETNSYAAFGQATWQASDQLGLTVGLRYTEDDKKGNEPIFAPHFFIMDPISSGPVDMEHDESWSKTTGKLGLEYSLTDKSLFYAIISTGYKSGGFNIGGLQAAYDPETVLAYEAGLKMLLAKERVQLNLATFLYEYKDLQVFQTQEAASLIANAAEATSQGIELELVAKPIDGLRINASLGWLDATLDQFDTEDPVQPELGLQDLSGNHLSRAPEWKFDLGVQYRWSLDNAGELTARIDYAWVDDQYFRPYNLESEKQDAYHQSNARLAWRRMDRHWEVDLWIKNIEDNDIVTNVQVSGTSAGSLPQGIIAPPRTFGLTVAYQL